MTALATPSQIECNKCAAPLTGGPDTFGDWPRAFCFTCYHDTLAETSPHPRRDFLIELLGALEEEEAEKEEEISDLKHDIDRLSERQTAIRKELGGKGTCDEEEPKPK